MGGFGRCRILLSMSEKDGRRLRVDLMLSRRSWGRGRRDWWIVCGEFYRQFCLSSALASIESVAKRTQIRQRSAYNPTNRSTQNSPRPTDLPQPHPPSPSTLYHSIPSHRRTSHSDAPHTSRSLDPARVERRNMVRNSSTNRCSYSTSRRKGRRGEGEVESRV